MGISPLLQRIYHPIAAKHDVELWVLRLDLIHPFVNGNKWYKLKYNLLTAINKYNSQNYSYIDLSHPDLHLSRQPKILTFGGAYSNHIYAAAAAGKLFNLPTIGIIRGEEHLPLNPTLDFAHTQGMELVYLSRDKYQKKHTPELQQELATRFGDIFVIPEGGCNLDGVRGCTEILATAQSIDFDIICLACGTGTTLAGIALSLFKNQQVIGFPVLKGGAYLQSEIASLINEYLLAKLPIPGDRSLNWQLICDYHFGGYARINQELILFQQEWQQNQGIILDYVYTSKLFFGVIDLIKQQYWQNSRLLLIHTGGTQGNRGMEQRMAKIAKKVNSS